MSALLDAAKAVAAASTGEIHEDYYRLHPCCNGPDFEREEYSTLLANLTAAVAAETDDIPEGWTWRLLTGPVPGFDIAYRDRTIASVYLTGAQASHAAKHRPVPVFLSETADVLTRHFARVCGDGEVER